MANQPGYQAPGQSNAAPQDSGAYYQNQIMGAGYGSGQNMFGGPGGGPSTGFNMFGGPQGQMPAQPQAAQQLLGSQFQAPTQLFSAAPQQQTAMSGGAPSGGQGGQFATKTGGLEEKPSEQEFTQPPPGPPVTGVAEVPGSRGSSGSPTYQYTDSSGNTYFVFPGGNTNMVDGQGNEVYNVQGLMSYEEAQAQLAVSGPANFLAGSFGGLSEFVSPTEQYRQAVMARDVTTPIEQALRSQLQGLAEERSGAIQSALRRQRGLGFTGMGGVDLSGLGSQYAQTSADIRTGAMNALDEARRAKAAEVFQLGYQARQEAGTTMQNNSDYARSQIDLLQVKAQNLTGGGNTVYVNPNLIADLSELSRLAMTKAVGSTEFNALVNSTMMKYGSFAFVAPDGTPMGSPDFELLSKSPDLL